MPTAEEIDATWTQYNRRQGSEERKARLQAQGWGKGKSGWTEGDRATLDIARIYRDWNDPYNLGIKPEDLHDRKSGRREGARKRYYRDQALY